MTSLRAGTIRARLERLRRRFFHKSNVIRTRAGTSTLPHPSPHRHRIVGRGLCMYRAEDFAHVPRAKRRPALELKLPVWSPFLHTGFHCVWAGSVAMVWMWDTDMVWGETSDNAGREPEERVRVLPETVFYPRKPDGVHLQACHEGFELQYWREDVLRDSFWFPERPDARQTDWFLARRDMAASRAAPEVSRTSAETFDPEPWAGRLSPGAWLTANEPALVAAGVLAFAMAALWQEIRIHKTRHFTRAAETEFARMQDEVAPLIEARNEFVGLRRKNLALATLLAAPSQAYLMGEVDRTLPSTRATFHEWQYQRGEISAVVEDAEPDPIAYVRALEAHPLFDKVKADQTRKVGRLKVSMRVDS